LFSLIFILLFFSPSQKSLYIDKIKDYDTIIPVIWRVDREGHCSAYGKEIQLSFYSLLEWIEKGEIKKNVNITLENEVNELISSVEFEDDGEYHGAWGTVIEVDEYGEFLINFIFEDFGKLKIYLNTIFKMIIGNFEYNILFGSFPFVGVEVNFIFNEKFGTWVCGKIFIKTSGELSSASPCLFILLEANDSMI
jgi:hypothetical protein